MHAPRTGRSSRRSRPTLRQGDTVCLARSSSSGRLCHRSGREQKQVHPGTTYNVVVPAVSRNAATFDLLRRWARLLDDVFRIPGTNIRFGLDPLVGLIPGLGDITSPLFALVLLSQGFWMRVPKVVLARMVLHAGVDALLGLFPVVGNIADVFWRANRWNLALLERHASPGRLPTRSDYVFVWCASAVLLLLIFLPLLLVIGLVVWLWNKPAPVLGV
ncbi:MAG: DUF4112 domain-containing protein [Luteitalea sp.]|nr:DUF4112 domain-containing protein [Luteitalea sp.]